MKRWKSPRLELIQSPFWDDKTTLPVVAAIKHDKEPAATEETERLFRVVLPFRDPHPKYIDWDTELLNRKVCPPPHGRAASIGANDKICVHFQSTAWGF